jgi:CelD/BcsL family acetyltransferase involved in cellulose biosynthesis
VTSGKDGLAAAPSLARHIAAKTCPKLHGTIRDVAWRELDSTPAIAAWDALAQTASEPNPFYESWYLLPSLRALDPDGTVSILRFEHSGELLGLLPVRRERRYYGRPIAHIGNWLHPNCFLGTPLVARGMERSFWQALLGWADIRPGGALFLHLANLPLGGRLETTLREVAAGQHRRAALVHRQERAMLCSELAPDAYWQAALNAKKRKELRRQHARLSELGTLAVERRDDAAGIAAWIETFLALEAAGWKGRAGSALAAHADTAELFRGVLAGAAQRGRLQRLALTLDGKPIAMLASLLAPPQAFAYKTCFDEAYAAFSPGVLLQRENLALLERDDISQCDSCAAAGHPMIDHVWRERRAIGRLSLAIGGPLRRRLFGILARVELARTAMPRD